jgi:hypothetical protein
MMLKMKKKVVYLMFGILFTAHLCSAQWLAGVIVDSTKYSVHYDSVAIKYGSGHKVIKLKINKNTPSYDLSISLDTFPLNCGSQSAKGTKITLTNLSNIEILNAKSNPAKGFFFDRCRSLSFLEEIDTASSTNQKYNWKTDQTLIAQARVVKIDCSNGPLWDFNEFGANQKYVGLRFLVNGSYQYAWLSIKAQATFDSAYIVVGNYYSEALSSKELETQKVRHVDFSIGHHDEQLDLNIHSTVQGMVTLALTDCLGQQLNHQKCQLRAGESTLVLPVRLQRSNQMYFVTLRGEGWVKTEKFLY